MMMRFWPFVACVLLSCSSGVMAHAHSSHPRLPLALSGLESGEWELRSRDGSSPTVRLCVSDIRQLLQPRHPTLNCRRLMIEDSAKQTVANYDCAHVGQGRTQLRV